MSPSLRPFLAQAEAEAVDFAEALGGEEALSPQKLAILRDTSRLGAILAALLAYLLQREQLDLDAVSKVATLVNARRQNLQALGLERAQKDVPDLRAYLAARENSQGRASAANGTTPQHDGVVLEVAPEGNVEADAEPAEGGNSDLPLAGDPGTYSGL